MHHDDQYPELTAEALRDETARSTCTDCGGGEPVHRLHPMYCRRCAEKNGHRNRFYVVIDVDRLRDLVGPEKADEISKRCIDPYGPTLW